MFRVGQKVVCVDASCVASGLAFSPLSEGGIYTIRAADVLMGVLLVEVPCPSPFVAFRPERFRHAVERKTDISIFTAMLNPSRQKVTV